MFYSFKSLQLTQILQMRQDALSWIASLAVSIDVRSLFCVQSSQMSSIKMVEDIPQPRSTQDIIDLIRKELLLSGLGCLAGIRTPIC